MDNNEVTATWLMIAQVITAVCIMIFAYLAKLYYLEFNLVMTIATGSLGICSSVAFAWSTAQFMILESKR